MIPTSSAAKRRALLIVPPTGRYIREDRCQTPIDRLKTVALRPPIDLMYAAASFEKGGFECKLVDYPGEEWGWKRLEADIRRFDPSHIVLSITTPSLEKDLKATKLAKRINREIVTIAKGAHFNTLDIDTMEKCRTLDIVLRGEYEETCLEIAKGEKPLAEIPGLTWRKGREVIRNASRPRPNDLDTIPYPARHLTNNRLYLRPDTDQLQTTIITNRGCPFSCTYCLANQVSGLKNRYRSVENVIGEIRECVDRFGIRNFLFRSDLFTQNKKWVKQLCARIVEEGLDIEWACNSRVDTLNPDVLAAMKEAGCWLIAFGVEKGTNEALEAINKKATVEQAEYALGITREAGIKRSIYILVGLPEDTRETIAADIEFAKRLDPDFLEIFYPYPFPGTPLYLEAVEKGLLKDGEIPREAYGLPAMPTRHLSVEELASIRSECLRKFYMRPLFIFRTLRQARSGREFTNYVKYGALQARQLVFGG